MAIGVEVREYTGEVVARGRFTSEDGVPAIGRAAHGDYARFPLLAGVGPYLDTSFNEWQCERVLEELAGLRPALDEHAVAAADELERLARMVIVDGPKQVHHRQLVFVGD